MTKSDSKKQFALWFADILRLRSIDVTRFIARHYGTEIGFIYVGGYPKSGTTWLSQLVAHYLDVPYADYNMMPLAFKGVVHNHWSYEPAFDRSIQVIRDGRDVMVSLYMMLMSGYLKRREGLVGLGDLFLLRTLVENIGGWFASLNRRFHRLFGRTFDPWDLERNLPLFIEAEIERPFIPVVKESWPQFICGWRCGAKKTTFVRYEDMLRDATMTLATALTHYLNDPIDQQEIEYTVKRYAFAKRTGRQPGVEDRNSFARKGIQGDWRNYFSREARQVFDHYAGDVLIALGYEPDHCWVDEVP